MTLKVIQGHIRPHLRQNHSSTFVYEPILMKICMNANIMKTYMTQNSLLCYGEVLLFFLYIHLRLISSHCILNLTNYNLQNRAYFCYIYRIGYLIRLRNIYNLILDKMACHYLKPFSIHFPIFLYFSLFQTRYFLFFHLSTFDYSVIYLYL